MLKFCRCGRKFLKRLHYVLKNQIHYLTPLPKSLAIKCRQGEMLFIDVFIYAGKLEKKVMRGHIINFSKKCVSAAKEKWNFSNAFKCATKDRGVLEKTKP